MYVCNIVFKITPAFDRQVMEHHLHPTFFCDLYILNIFLNPNLKLETKGRSFYFYTNKLKTCHVVKDWQLNYLL